MIKSKRKLNKHWTIGNIRVRYVQDVGGYRYRLVTNLLTGDKFGFSAWQSFFEPLNLPTSIHRGDFYPDDAGTRRDPHQVVTA